VAAVSQTARMACLRSFRCVAATCAAAAMLSAAPAQAQLWRLERSVGSNVTWTSNALLGIAAAEPDVVLEVSPRLAIRGEGSRLRVGGSVELTAVHYANSTRPGRLLPAADLTGRLEAVDNFLFLEAGVRVLQEVENPFGSRATDGASGLARNTREFRFAPSIESTIRDGLRYQLRSENLRTSETRAALSVDAPSGSGYFGRHSASIVQDPRPFGWYIEAERTDTQYDESIQTNLVLDTARAGVDYALLPELRFGVHGGVERNSFFRIDPQRSIYGLSLNWRPSERTRLALFEEKRYFGPGWRVEFDHRSPFLAWTFFLSRGTETAPQGIAELPATDNVAGLLDALFATRFPDPAERARKVREFMAQQALPDATSRSTSLFSQRLSLSTTARGTVALVGARGSAVFGFFSSRFVDAPEAGELATGRTINNNTQRGIDLTLTRRLSPTISATAAFDLSRIQAIATVTGDRTTQAGARVSLRKQLAARTSASVGASARKLSSNVTPSGKQVSVFAGFEHGF
jgi:uncharacterized protein (PEP-CTERM system associated)